MRHPRSIAALLFGLARSTDATDEAEADTSSGAPTTTSMTTTTSPTSTAAA